MTTKVGTRVPWHATGPASHLLFMLANMQGVNHANTSAGPEFEAGLGGTVRNSLPKDCATDNSLPASQNQDGRGRPLAPQVVFHNAALPVAQGEAGREEDMVRGHHTACAMERPRPAPRRGVA